MVGNNCEQQLQHLAVHTSDIANKVIVIHGFIFNRKIITGK